MARLDELNAKAIALRAKLFSLVQTPERSDPQNKSSAKDLLRLVGREVKEEPMASLLTAAAIGVLGEQLLVTSPALTSRVTNLVSKEVEHAFQAITERKLLAIFDSVAAQLVEELVKRD